MPAVDYRLGGGELSLAEISELLKTLVASGRAVGMDITIFNPQLDLGGSITRRFVSSLAQGFLERTKRVRASIHFFASKQLYLGGKIY
jgi:arginase